jgi:hypothetical protein
MRFDMKTPCTNCPFRSDVPAYLRKSRVREIENALVRRTFACHKTTVDHEDEDGNCDRIVVQESQHCAGALILLEKTECQSDSMQFAERLGIYTPDGLDLAAPVYNSFDEMIEAQPE